MYNVRILNYPEALEGIQRELGFILDEMNRFKIIKFSKSYINETKGLKVQRDDLDIIII